MHASASAGTAAVAGRRKRRLRQACSPILGNRRVSVSLAVHVAILATAALTASCANETHQQQPNVEDEDDPSYIRKLHHLLPSFLFASAEEQAGRQEMMQAPPSKSFKSRICGAGSNADLDGTCANGDDGDDTDDADTDGGDGSGSNEGEAVSYTHLKLPTTPYV